MVTNRNKKRAPKYSQKRKEIGRIKGRQRGWKWGTETEHRNGCQIEETSKVMKKKNGSNKNRDCKKLNLWKRAPLEQTINLFSSFYNAFFLMKF